MSARIYGGIPLTLMLLIALLQNGAAAGWWPAVMPAAALLTSLAAWACGCWLLWQIDTARHVAPPPAASVGPVPRPVAAPPAPAAERRHAPRFNLHCPVEIETGGHATQRGDLRDISQGGARIAGVPGVAAETYGLLSIPGINLKVPFRALPGAPPGEIRVRFELTGLALDRFVGQFERLVDAGTNAEAVNVSATRVA